MCVRVQFETMKIFWFLIFISLVVKLNCQEDDYDTDPEDAINDYSSPSEQPEFFKNAFNENQSNSRQIHPQISDNALNQYLNYFPFSSIGDGRSSFYPSYFPMMTGQSFESSIDENQRNVKPMITDDYFGGYSPKTKDQIYNAPKSINSINDELNALNGKQQHSKMMFNYGFPAPYANRPSPMFNGRLNSYQTSPAIHPIGSHLYPYTQRHRKPDSFDEELKALGIDLGEMGLGGEENSSEETNSKKKEKKDQDKKKKKKDKKRPSFFPNLLSSFKTTTTTTESTIQNQYLKSNIDNDINNLGFNLDNYGIKEHKLEKQVYGNEGRYQYPMQATNTGSSNAGLSTVANLPNQSMMDSNSNNLNDLSSFKSSLNNYNLFGNDDKLSNLLKSNDDQALLPLINSHNNDNSLLTSDGLSSTNGFNNLNDVTAINLLENSFNDLNGFKGKTHEYQHTNIPDNLNQNFKPFLPKPNGNKKYENRPKFLDNDPFFKDDKQSNLDADSNGYETSRKKGRKGKSN